MLIGEAWGKDEEEAAAPFVGASGKLLNALLSQAGIKRSECYLTNVFNLRPKPNNDIKNLCGTKVEGVAGYPAVQKGKFILKQYQPEIDRLFNEIAQVKPNLIVTLGATPTWALLKTTGIKDIRGAPVMADCGRKVLPTYHPAAIMRDYSLRPIVLSDLFKAVREEQFPEVRRPRREIWVEPLIDDLDKFFRSYILPSPDLSIDIETKGRMITCIGFAPSIDRAIVIPFYNSASPDGNYWPSFEQERYAWNFVRKCCALNKRIVFQNGLYDMNFLWTEMGIPTPHASEDTMLLHHALQPEMNKGLGFLGSIYTDEASWKLMRNAGTVKRED